MIRVLVFLAVLAALAGGAAWLADRPGNVEVVWLGQRIETSVVVALVGIVALAFVLMLIWTVVRFVAKLPDIITLASRARRRTRGFAAVSRGMIAVGAGDPSAARRHAGDAERYLGQEPLTLLLKAQAAQITGDRAGAEAAFNRMLDEPETRVLGLRGLYVEAKRKGDRVAARAYATKAAQLSPNVGWANEAVLEYQSVERDWRGALATLERRASLRLIDKDAAKRQRAVLLTADAIDRADREPDAAFAGAQEAVKLAPTLVPASVIAGKLAARQNSLRKAAKILESGWRASPHPDIAAAYIDLRAGDSALDRLGRAETLMRLRPSHPEARLALAEAAVGAREFARARETLTPLITERPGVRACLLMAEIEEGEHGSTGAVRYWLARASRAPRDPAWIADGVAVDHWEPVAPSGRLDGFVWAAPPDALVGPEAEMADAVIADANEAVAPPSSVADDEAEDVTVASHAPGRPDRPTATASATEVPERPAAGHDEEPAQTEAGARNGRTNGAALATPVVFPVPHAPDDPGAAREEPDEEPAPVRSRLFG